MAECQYSGLLRSCSPQDANCAYGASLTPCVMVVLICIAFSELPCCQMLCHANVFVLADARCTCVNGKCVV